MKINIQIDKKFLWGVLLSPVLGIVGGMWTASIQGFLAVASVKVLGYVNGTAVAYGLMFVVLSGLVIVYVDRALKTIYPIVGLVAVGVAIFCRGLGSLAYLDCGDNCSGVQVQQPIFNQATARITSILWIVFATCCVAYLMRLLAVQRRQQ